VLDFGISRHMVGADGSKVKGSGGTPMYMAPEQLRGEPVGPPADVFALGCILFEILAREPLRAGGQLPTDRSPARRRPDRAIAPELDAACQAAVADDADARPTAHELGERVQRYLDGDRDLEARRMLAAEHLARAREAMADGDRAAAMHAAGRALGLDPESDAASLIGSLLIEPPRETPPEVEAAYARLDADLMRSQARHAAYSTSALFAFLPFFAFLHVTSWPLVLATFGVPILTIAIMWHGSRQERPDTRPVFLTQIVFVVLMTRIFSPFLIVPALAALFVTSMTSFAGRLDHPVRTIAVACAGPAIAVVVELAGWVQPTWHIDAHSFVFTSAAFDIGSHVTEVLLVGSLLGSLVVGGLFSHQIAVERRTALRKLELQAWHLRKVVGR